MEWETRNSIPRSHVLAQTWLNMKTNNEIFDTNTDTIFSCNFLPFPACKPPISSFYHLEEGNISVTPQTRNPHAEPACGAAWGSLLTLDFASHGQCSSDPPVSSDTPTRRMRILENFGRLRFWIWLWEVFRLKCPVWLREESHWLLLLAKCLDSSGSALRTWRAKLGSVFKQFDTDPE